LNAITTPSTTNGMVFPIRWPSPRAGRRGDYALEPVDLARLDAVRVEVRVGDLVDDLDQPHDREQREDEEEA